MVAGRVAGVQPDLVPVGRDLVDHPGAHLVVRGRVAVGRVMVPRHQEVRRSPAARLLDLVDPLERPVRVAFSHQVDRQPCQPPRLRRQLPAVAAERRRAHAPAGRDHAALARPPPRRVDVVRQHHPEPLTPFPPGRLPEPPQQRVHRRLLGIGQRVRRRETSVPVARRTRPLLPARQVPERARHHVLDAVPEVQQAILPQHRWRRLAAVEVLPRRLRAGQRRRGVRDLRCAFLRRGAGRRQRLDHPRGPRVHRLPPRSAP